MQPNFFLLFIFLVFSFTTSANSQVFVGSPFVLYLCQCNRATGYVISHGVLFPHSLQAGPSINPHCWLVMVGYRTLIVTKTQFCIGPCSIAPTTNFCFLEAPIVSRFPDCRVLQPFIFWLLQPIYSPLLAPCSFFPSCHPLHFDENMPLQSLFCLCKCC